MNYAIIMQFYIYTRWYQYVQDFVWISDIVTDPRAPIQYKDVILPV